MKVLSMEEGWEGEFSDREVNRIRLRREWTKGDYAFADGKESKESKEVLVSLISKPWQGESQDANGKGGKGSSGPMAGFASGDFHKSPDRFGISAGA
jgi:hypothetical protein